MGQMFKSLRGAALAAYTQEQKSIAFSRYYNDLAVRGLHMASRDHWPIERAITEGYERVIWCFKSVNVLATDSSGLPFRLRDRGMVLDDHPLYRVLNKKANALESGQVFRKRLSSQVLLSKRGAFVQRVKSNAGTIKEAHLLPPDRVEIIPAAFVSGFERTDQERHNVLVDHFRLTRHNGSVKNLEPDEVMWFRDPHPTDPYSGITPLEAAGMSVELDHFARLYNVSFMQNDGRPGGVLAVRDTAGGSGDIDPKQMDRIEQRFGKGPVEAGKLSVIAGELSYIDLATRPRDMQYGQTSANSKMELLAAFGMSEVVLGNAAGRTFDNADAEMYNYWTRTIPAHNRILLDGFDDDSEDDLEGFFDTSEVEVLERQAKARREEARAEVTAGLRSIKSYADMAGFGDEVEDNVYTRSLYQPNGKTPLPTKAGDAALLGLDTASAPPSGDVAGGAPVAPGDAPAPPGGAEPPAAAVASPVAPGAVEGIDMAALQAPVDGTKHLRAVQGSGARPKARFALSRKSPEWGTAEPDDRVQQALEAELAEALTALTERWIERAAARAASPRQRKGTRHWEPEFEHDTRVGRKALDTAKAVDEDTWQQEAEEKVSPIVTAAAIAAAYVILSDLGITPPVGKTLREVAAELVKSVIKDVVRMVGQSAARQARLLAKMANDADQRGETIAAIRDLIHGRIDETQRWAQGVSISASTGTINGSRDAAANDAVLDDETLEVRREWITKRDTKVRPSHHDADGQVRAVREPFIVGDSLLRFPGDPLAPIHETANCRCRLRYRHRRTGRFVSIPESVAALN